MVSGTESGETFSKSERAGIIANSFSYLGSYSLMLNMITTPFVFALLLFTIT